MSDTAPARRFACRACRALHVHWSARCPRCHSLEGLANAADLPPLLPAAVEQPSAEETPALPERSRLVVVRAEPSLEDPVEELTDISDPDEDDSDEDDDPDEDDDDDAVLITEVTEASFVRNSTGLAALDHVLGGGLVVGSVVLIASPPGSGKTSLALQMLAGLGHPSLYVSAEETREAVAATARRIGAAADKLRLLIARDVDKIFSKARKHRSQTIVIDSIQKMLCTDLDGRAGSPGQLRECTSRLVEYAKTTNTSLWIIGHVTSDGGIAGPRTIEHDVDVVLELDRGTGMDGNERILRVSGKNRYGDGSAVGRFELTAKGLVGVDGDGWNVAL